MKYNTRIRYGIRTMLEIALEKTGKGVLQKDISVRQKISVKYLDSIIASLKVAGLITTTKGKKSGYMITRSPDQIRIFDIYKAFEPEIAIVDCMSCNYDCELEGECGAKYFWDGLNEKITDHFQTFTLKDLLEMHHTKQPVFPGKVQSN